MALKNGTAAYHGNAYWFNQNNILNANLFHTNLVGGSKPPVHFNEYGGTFGGPVRIPKLYNGKDKTFWLFGFARHHEKASETFTGDVPSPEMLNGNFNFFDATGNPLALQFQ